MYDDVFTIGSNMLKEKFEFSYNETDYILWAWKGDYWNLGSGTEIGLYDYNRTFDGTPHYDVVDFELPMTLNLYNYHSKDSIENIFCWAPDEQDEKQWWITGFNPDFYFPIDPNQMVTLGSVDFTGYEDMYDALKRDILIKSPELLDFLIFDDDNHTVWVIWY